MRLTRVTRHTRRETWSSLDGGRARSRDDGRTRTTPSIAAAAIDRDRDRDDVRRRRHRRGVRGEHRWCSGRARGEGVDG